VILRIPQAAIYSTVQSLQNSVSVMSFGASWTTKARFSKSSRPTPSPPASYPVSTQCCFLWVKVLIVKLNIACLRFRK